MVVPSSERQLALMFGIPTPIKKKDIFDIYKGMPTVAQAVWDNIMAARQS